LYALGNLVSKALDQVNDLNEVGDGTFGGLFEDFSNENNELVSSGVIDAGNDSGGVSEFVLLKESVESLLENFFVCDSCGQSNN
ncbi:unnamed protein product, partial [Sphagnum balticum]